MPCSDRHCGHMVLSREHMRLTVSLFLTSAVKGQCQNWCSRVSWVPMSQSLHSAGFWSSYGCCSGRCAGSSLVVGDDAEALVGHDDDVGVVGDVDVLEDVEDIDVDEHDSVDDDDALDVRDDADVDLRFRLCVVAFLVRLLSARFTLSCPVSTAPAMTSRIAFARKGAVL